MTIPEFCRRGVAAQMAINCFMAGANLADAGGELVPKGLCVPRKHGPPAAASPIITRSEVFMEAPGHWTYRLFDATGRKRFEGGAASLSAASAQATEYARQIECGAIVL